MASLRGVLEVEASLEPDEDLNEIGEVINYIDAMRYGLETVRTEPISVALITEIHWLLLRNTRGADRFPGEIRRDQNYSGRRERPRSGRPSTSRRPPRRSGRPWSRSRRSSRRTTRSRRWSGSR